MLHSRTDDYRISLHSGRGADTASGVVDKAFALISVAIVVAACLTAMYAWIAPGWPQIPILAALYLLVRSLLWQVFDPKTA